MTTFMSPVASTPSQTDAWQSASLADSAPNLQGACALLALLVQTQSSTEGSAKTDVELNAKKLEELKQQLADSIRQAKEAADHSGFLGFLGDIFGSDIAKVAGAVAALAATVATAGAAAPLLAVTVALQATAKVAAELGLDPKLCMALSIVAAAVGVASGAGACQAATALTEGAHYVEVGAKIVQGSAVITGGVFHYAASEYHTQELNYQADAVNTHAKQTVTQLSIDDAFSLLERALRAEQRETSTVSEIVQNNSDTNAILCSRI